MFASFIPPEAERLRESTSVALLQQIERQLISTPLSEQPIATAYVRRGSGGTPILLLHGFDSSLVEFRRLIPLLAEKTETWAVDLLGFGFTERNIGLKFGSVAIKTHLFCFWKTFIARPVILVGASMGGAAAIDFTLTYPEAVEKLVLIDSAGFANPPMAAKFMFFPFNYLSAQFLRHPKVRQSICRAAYYDKTLACLDAQICATLHLESPGWDRALISFTKSGGYSPFGEQLKQIKQPTLILWGMNDKILGTKDAYKFKLALTNSQLVWIKNCGHVPHLEKPEITAQEILNFKENELHPELNYD